MYPQGKNVVMVEGVSSTAYRSGPLFPISCRGDNGAMEILKAIVGGRRVGLRRRDLLGTTRAPYLPIQRGPADSIVGNPMRGVQGGRAPWRNKGREDWLPFFGGDGNTIHFSKNYGNTIHFSKIYGNTIHFLKIYGNTIHFSNSLVNSCPLAENWSKLPFICRKFE